VTTSAYASTNDQWTRPACPLVNSSKTKPRQFSSVTSVCTRLYGAVNTRTVQSLLQTTRASASCSIVAISLGMGPTQAGLTSLVRAVRIDTMLFQSECCCYASLIQPHLAFADDRTEHGRQLAVTKIDWFSLVQRSKSSTGECKAANKTRQSIWCQKFVTLDNYQSFVNYWLHLL